MTSRLPAKPLTIVSQHNMTHPLILPMLIQMGLTLFILFWLAYGRLTTIKKAGGIQGLIKQGGFKPNLVNRSDNFKNQFEVPIVFYALCLLFIATDTFSQGVVIAAWVFVIARICHAIVHTTFNTIFPHRFLCFLVSALALVAMLVMAFLQMGVS